MAAPVYLQNANTPVQVVDTLIDASGTTYYKKAGPGATPISGVTGDAAPHAVSTHAGGAAVGATDGLVAIAAKDSSGNAAPVNLDASGNLKVTGSGSGGSTVVTGPAASGSAVSGNPVLTAGSDGTNARTMLTDTSGRPQVVGAAASGAAAAGNPVLAAGSDGTNARSLSTDAGGHVQTVVGGVTDGAGTYATARIPNVFKTAVATAAGNTAAWTPTSGKKFRLLRYQIELTANVSLTAGAVITISFQDATTAMPIAHDVYVPTTAVTTTAGDAYNSGWIDLGGLGILSATANNVLNVNLGSALATGNCRVNVAGTEE